LSRLERRLGQYFYKIGKTEKAIDAYKLAVKYLQQVLEGYRYVSPSFREMAEKVYFELADLLLQAAKSNPTFLQAAIDNIELQNYFQDECVTNLKEKLKAVDRILSPDTAIFYPIVLHNRVELLFTFHDGHQQFETDITPTYLRQAATNFREKLASETKQQQRLINLLPGVEIDEFNDYAQQLYQGFA
jgi:CHAT domain-containing protein